MKFQDYVASLPYNGYLVNTDQPRPLSGRDRIQSKSLFLTYPPPMVSSFSLIQTARFLSILRLSYLSRSCSQFVQIYVMTYVVVVLGILLAPVLFLQHSKGQFGGKETAFHVGLQSYPELVVVFIRISTLQFFLGEIFPQLLEQINFSFSYILKWFTLFLCSTQHISN